jgi:hypothetical protein
MPLYPIVRSIAMTYAFYLDVPADDALYAEIRAELPAESPAGLLAHLVTPCERGLRYIDVWESKESWELAHDTILEPAVGRVLERHGLPHDESLTRFEEIRIVDLWGPIEQLAGR